MPPEFNVTDIQRKWVHSHEEDSENTLVYRPAEHHFPPARGRDALEFLPNGELRYEGPGPDDRLTSATGNWTFDGEAITLDIPGRGTERLNIKSVDSSKLELAR